MNNILEALRGDFKLFLQALWQQLELPSPTRAQYAIADYLQNGPKRLQIQAFRGVGKSWITGGFVLWTLFKDPERKIMIISASKERADNMSIFLQKLIIETPWLSHLRPKGDDSGGLVLALMLTAHLTRHHQLNQWVSQVNLLVLVLT